MKIPERFEMFGHTFTVQFDKQLVRRNEAVGEAHYRFKEILLQSDCEGVPMQDSQLEQHFWHEVVHHILNEMGEIELRDNEKFVDVFGSLLQQVLATSQGDLVAFAKTSLSEKKENEK